MMCTMPWLGDWTSKNSTPNSAQFLRRASICLAAMASTMRRRSSALVRDVVVDGGDGAVGAAELAACHAEAVEGLRGGDLVDEMQVDVEERRFALGLGDEVLLPDFFE